MTDTEIACDNRFRDWNGKSIYPEPEAGIFDLLEAVSSALRDKGCDREAIAFGAAYARRTGGVDLPYLTTTIADAIALSAGRG